MVTSIYGNGEQSAFLRQRNAYSVDRLNDRSDAVSAVSEPAHLLVSSTLSTALSITSMLITSGSTNRLSLCFDDTLSIRFGRSSAVTIAAQEAHPIPRTLLSLKK